MFTKAKQRSFTMKRRFQVDGDRQKREEFQPIDLQRSNQRDEIFEFRGESIELRRSDASLKNGEKSFERQR